ncbi:MAG: VWA domain-containing protein [Pseudomonadota bacterium]
MSDAPLFFDAIRIFAVAPAQFGGFWLRMRPGPVYDAALTAITKSVPAKKHRKIHPGFGDDALYGSLDLAQTLADGKLIHQKGVLSRPGAVLHLVMAERAKPALAAKLGLAVDGDTDHTLIACDEGAEPEEALHPIVTRRLAFHFDLNEILPSRFDLPTLSYPAVEAARQHLKQVKMPVEQTKDLVTAALAMGITDPNIPIFATLVARISAAYTARDIPNEADILLAAKLIYAPRAIHFANEEPEQNPPPQSDPMPEDHKDDGASGKQSALEDKVLEATQAVLPKGLLACVLAQNKMRNAGSSDGSGAHQIGNRKGRPLAPKSGRPSSDKRIDLVATLRRAIPHQNTRPKINDTALAIWPDDLRFKRFEARSDRLVIFAVDASGSAAAARLAEAKGAVELLLSEAYVRRDHIALIAFRQTDAELLLPPTRSIVSAKKRLAALPGGGGTPLATGLKSSLDLALSAKRRGMTPALVLLSDGGANIGLDGIAGRPQAREDADHIAKLIRSAQIKAMVVDIGRRPDAHLKSLSTQLDGAYIQLPNAGAEDIAQLVELTNA